MYLKHIISSNFNHIFRKNVQFPPTESMKAFNQTSACPKNDVNIPAVLRSDLCYYSDTYIVVNGIITVVKPNGTKRNKSVAFKNNAPFINFI